MEGNGIVLKEGEAAHHIVPSTHSYKSAQDARAILDDFDININNFNNGVGLPPSIHGGLHTHEYMDKVAALLKVAAKTGDKAEAIFTLKSIAKKLKQGSFI